MTARQAIDEVEGLYLRISFEIPGTLHGESILGQGRGMVVTVTIPTGNIGWTMLRKYIKSERIEDPRDEGYLTTRLNVPLLNAIIVEFNRRSPLISEWRRKKVENWLAQELGYGNWQWNTRFFKKIDFVNSKGEPFDLRSHEREYLGGILGEDGEELGWVDPKGVLSPKGLHADVEVTLSLNVGDFEQQRLKFPVRVGIPWDVEWAAVTDWIQGHLTSAFYYGPPFNLTNIQVLNPADEETLESISKTHISAQTVVRSRWDRNRKWLSLAKIGTPTWVTKDGQPYPTQNVQRRHVNSLLGEAIEVASVKVTVEINPGEFPDRGLPSSTIEAELDVRKGTTRWLENGHQRERYTNMPIQLLRDRRPDSDWWKPLFCDWLTQHKPDLVYQGTWTLRDIKYFDTGGREISPVLVDRAAIEKGLGEGAKQVIEAELEPDIKLWANQWSAATGSAFGIWGTEAQWEILRTLVKRGTQVKSVFHPMEKHDLIKQGWKVLFEEYNPSSYGWDAYEGILIRQ